MKSLNDVITLTDVIDKLNTWMQQQLQQLLVAKANLELIKETGGQILSSSISK